MKTIVDVWTVWGSGVCVGIALAIGTLALGTWTQRLTAQRRQHREGCFCEAIQGDRLYSTRSAKRIAHWVKEGCAETRHLYLTESGEFFEVCEGGLGRPPTTLRHLERPEARKWVTDLLPARAAREVLESWFAETISLA